MLPYLAWYAYLKSGIYDLSSLYLRHNISCTFLLERADAITTIGDLRQLAVNFKRDTLFNDFIDMHIAFCTSKYH